MQREKSTEIVTYEIKGGNLILQNFLRTEVKVSIDIQSR